MEHDLYETGDLEAPDAIKDRNGEVVLGLCKRCGAGEVKLERFGGKCPGDPQRSEAMDLYGEPIGVEYFRDLMAEYPDVRFFHPSFEKAPWHVIAEVPGVDGITRRAHFWPHVMKVCPQYDDSDRPSGPARIGADAMREVIAECRLAPDAVDLFEE